MGRPKEDLLLGGLRFGDRVRRAAEDAFDRVVAVQRFGGPPAENLATIHEAEHEGSGAIFGLERALVEATGPAIWLLGVDFPLVTGALLRDLRMRFERSSAEALVPWWDGGPQPLCAGWAVAILPRLRRAIRERRLRMNELIEMCEVEFVPESDLRMAHPGEPLLNVNDSVELDRARRIDENADASR